MKWKEKLLLKKNLFLPRFLCSFGTIICAQAFFFVTALVLLFFFLFVTRVNWLRPTDYIGGLFSFVLDQMGLITWLNRWDCKILIKRYWLTDQIFKEANISEPLRNRMVILACKVSITNALICVRATAKRALYNVSRKEVQQISNPIHPPSIHLGSFILSTLLCLFFFHSSIRATQ